MPKKVKGKTRKKASEALRHKNTPRQIVGAGDVGGALHRPPDPGDLPAPDPGGGGDPPGAAPPNDLGIPDLPPDVAAKIHEFFVTYGADKDAAQAAAMDYLVTTPWFKHEYAGYDQGVSKFGWSDPLHGGLAQYRDYKTRVTNSYQQYYGRPATQEELASFIGQGWTPEHVEGVGQGHSWATANTADVQYLAGAFGEGQFTAAELQSLGEQNSGLNSELGASLNARFQSALARMQGVFQGKLGSSALGDQALGDRLQKKPDISA